MKQSKTFSMLAIGATAALVLAGCAAAETETETETDTDTAVGTEAAATSVIGAYDLSGIDIAVGGGGLGETINSGLKLDRGPAILIGAVMVAIMALLFDFLSALAQTYLKPKGL